MSIMKSDARLMSVVIGSPTIGAKDENALFNALLENRYVLTERHVGVCRSLGCPRSGIKERSMLGSSLLLYTVR